MRQGFICSSALLWLALLFPAATSTAQAPTPATLPDLREVTVWGVHDPSMIKAGNTWYVFSSGGRTDGPQLPIHCSTDLLTWTRCGHIFPETPAWIKARLPGVQDLWAPDISFENGEYRIYYAYSVFGRNTSGIALVTNKTLDSSSPDYAWTDRGTVLESTAQDDFNTIDPNFIRDSQGRDWLAFGSFYSGIKMRRLAPDGSLDPLNLRQFSLAKREKPANAEWPRQGDLAEWEAIEAPFVVRHGEYYYLFTSWDLCCRGAMSNYRVVVGRAKSITGPYTDETGRKLTDGGGTTILAGKKSWVGTGGQSIWPGPNDEDVMIYHAYDKTTGRVSMRLAPIQWIDYWPAIGTSE